MSKIRFRESPELYNSYQKRHNKKVQLRRNKDPRRCASEKLLSKNGPSGKCFRESSAYAIKEAKIPKITENPELPFTVRKKFQKTIDKRVFLCYTNKVSNPKTAGSDVKIL